RGYVETAETTAEIDLPRRAIVIYSQRRGLVLAGAFHERFFLQRRFETGLPVICSVQRRLALRWRSLPGSLPTGRRRDPHRRPSAQRGREGGSSDGRDRRRPGSARRPAARRDFKPGSLTGEGGMANKRELGEALRRFRRGRRVTGTELASRIGVTQG